MKKQNLLLLEDIGSLGRSGEVVSVRSGYARNYLLPQKLAYIADAHTVRLQKKLQEERAKKAAKDKKESEELAKRLKDVHLKTEVKVDPEGRLYGSVSAQDISALLQQEGFEIAKKHILLKKPIKELGSFSIAFNLLEDVPATVQLEVIPEGGFAKLSKIQAQKQKQEVKEVIEEEKEKEKEYEKQAEEAKEENE